MTASPVTGLHHVTAIAGPAQQNVDFYNGLLGLRFVKKTVNFDDPGTYHLYYADGEARAGSFLTFFPWADAVPGRPGEGQAVTTAYAVPIGAIDRWMDRFATEGYDAFDAPAERFGQRILPLRAPDGLALELIETPEVTGGWAEGPIPPHEALGAFHGVTLCVADPEPTLRLLTEAMGYREAGHDETGRTRLENPSTDRASIVEVYRADERGRMGTGIVHHVAFRVPDDEAQRDLQVTLARRGLRPTPVVDRTYFHSVYFREPGGILFEIATDAPGFAIDEPTDRLGHTLALPPQHEPLRERLEQSLPPLTIPYPDR